MVLLCRFLLVSRILGCCAAFYSSGLRLFRIPSMPATAEAVTFYSMSLFSVDLPDRPCLNDPCPGLRPARINLLFIARDFRRKSIAWSVGSFVLDGNRLFGGDASVFIQS